MRGGLHTLGRGNPTIAITDQANEKGTAAFHFRQTYLQHQHFLGVFFVGIYCYYTPTQINGLEVMASLY